MSTKNSKLYTFRLSKKQKYSPRYFSQDKNSMDSFTSQFSHQYNLLSKQARLDSLRQSSYLKANTLQHLNRKLGHLRLQTESAHLQTPKQSRKEFNLPVSVPYHKAMQLKQNKNQLNITRSWKFRVSMNRQANMDQSVYLKGKFQSIDDDDEKPIPVHSKQCSDLLRITQHSTLLLDIAQQINAPKRIVIRQLGAALKKYVLEKDQYQLSWSENIFQCQEDKAEFRELQAYEKVVVLGIINLVAHEKVEIYLCECLTLLRNLLGIYLHIIKQLSYLPLYLTEHSSVIKQLLEQMANIGVKQRRNLTNICLLIASRTIKIFKPSPDLYTKMKIITKNASKSSTNRIFYRLLTLYAIYLNSGAINELKYSFLNSLATCPSPFVLEPRRNRKYTLVVDLDETLVHTKIAKGSNKIHVRPFAKEFVKLLSEKYEIIIFTSAVSDYAEEVISNFDGISHVLCREHTIKLKGESLKDLQKIGRPLNSMIIIDNLPQNFRLQPDLGIAIRSWHGDSQDRELEKIYEFLNELADRDFSNISQQLVLLRKTLIFH